MKNIAKILNKEGIFIVEVHYLVSLIKTLQYDTIYHEHMRYYSLTSLNYLFKKFNFRIFKAKEIINWDIRNVYNKFLSSFLLRLCPTR